MYPGRRFVAEMNSIVYHISNISSDYACWAHQDSVIKSEQFHHAVVLNTSGSTTLAKFGVVQREHNSYVLRSIQCILTVDVSTNYPPSRNNLGVFPVAIRSSCREEKLDFEELKALERMRLSRPSPNTTGSISVKLDTDPWH